MIETWLGPLTIEVLRSVLILFCVAVVGQSLISKTIRLLGSKGERKREPEDLESKLIGMIILPLSEELAFRGPVFYFSNNLVFSWLLVFLWGGAFFGFVHSFPRGKKYWKKLPNKRELTRIATLTGFTGIISGFLVITTKSLIAAMIFHVLFNAYLYYLELPINKNL